MCLICNCKVKEMVYFQQCEVKPLVKLALLCKLEMSLNESDARLIQLVLMHLLVG